MSLLEELRRRREDAPVLVCQRDHFTAQELVVESERLRGNQFAEIDGQVGTLRFRDMQTYLTALIALDGLLDSMLIVDDDIGDNLLSEFESTLGCTCRVTAASDSLTVEKLSGSANGGQSEASTQWIIPTSGTTGTPKLIGHSFESLTRSVKPPTATAGQIRWGLVYSPTRFAGIQVVMQALCGGSCLIAPNDLGNFDESIAFLSQNDCNALSATPSLWRKLAFAGTLATLDMQLVTLGGEAPDQKILDTLTSQFPAAIVRHIYASTEAGVGFSVSDGLIGFPESYLTDPPLGIELRLREDGVLLLRAQGYRQNILSGDHSIIDSEGWVASGDTVHVDNGRCYFLGRANGAINVGGSKVHPTAIELVLSEVPGVVAAHVFGKPNAVLGSLVVAEIVAAGDAERATLKKQLAEHCKSRLSRVETPALFKFVDQLELTSTGKIKR